MKASILQTPRPANRARSKETPLSEQSDPNSGEGKSQKIVPKRLSWVFSTAPKYIHHDLQDPADSSPEATSTMEDPAKPPISAILASSKMDEIAVVESGEPTGGSTASDAAKEEEKEMDEETVRALLRVREALLEIGASDVSDGSKKTVETLVNIMIGDVGTDSKATDGLSKLDFWAHVRTTIPVCLLWLLVLMHAFVATALWFGRGREEAFVDSPPT